MSPASSPPVPRGFFALLRNRSFLALWGGQALSQVSDKVLLTLAIALSAIYQPLPFLSGASMSSAIMIAFVLPAILFGSAAGIFVDRWYKKQILVVGNIIQGLLILALIPLPKDCIVLLIITFLVSTINQFFVPSEQAAMPLLVRHENLMAANAVFSTTLIGSLIVGFGVGDLLLSTAERLGGYGRELVLGSMYLTAALLLNGMRIKERGVAKRSTDAHLFSDLKDGLRYLRQNRLIRNAMLQLIVLYSVFAALVRLSISLVEEIGLQDKQFGLLLAAAGVGLLLGVVVLGIWGDRLHHKPLPLFGFLTIAFVLAIYPFIQNLQLGLALSIGLGFGAAFIAVPMQTLIQQQTPEAMRGKVFGFQNNAVNIALTLPLLIAIILVEKIGLRWTLLGMSIGVGVIGVWTWRTTKQALEDQI